MNDNEEVAQQPKGLTEDWTAVVVGLGVLLSALATSFLSRPKDVDWAAAETKAAEIRQKESELSVEEEAKLSPDERKALSKKRSEAMLKKVGIAWEPAIKPWLAKLSSWGELSPVKKDDSAKTDSTVTAKPSGMGNPLDSFRKRNKEGKPEGRPLWELPLVTCLLLAVVGSIAVFLRGHSLGRYLVAFPALFALAVLSYLLAEQAVIKYYNLEYAMWALLVGMVVCNTVGVPKWLEPAVQGEIYIKIGLILLGAEVLFSQLLALGIPGVFVSWLVTPTVLIGTYVFGQKILKMESRSLNMVISADMSVCGVSAAIATSAACKAKKEELSLAIGLSLAFTAIMMVVMPRVILWMELDPVVGGAWIGGTIDSTGAVAAAGTALGIRGSETAITVKMIQNILIGVVAMGVAIYWTRWVEPAEQQTNAKSDSSTKGPLLKTGLSEIWRRFPKFVLGFIAASLIFSAIFGHSFFGASWVQATTKDFTVLIRGWLFCLAFVSLGLTTNFRQLAPYLIAGKPMVLYVCGQALNLLLTFLMAYLMFGILFKS